MSLRIYGATSGYIELDAPAVANSASVTLPTTNGVLATTSDIAGMTLITSGTLSGASITLSNIPSTYQELRLIIRNYLPVTDGIGIQMRVNGDSNANRYRNLAAGAQSTFNGTQWNPGYGNDNTVAQGLMITSFPDYANTSTWKFASFMVLTNNITTPTNPDWDAPNFGLYNQTAAISSITVFPSSGNFAGGTYFLYGVK